jgi:fructokinase
MNTTSQQKQNEYEALNNQPILVVGELLIDALPSGPRPGGAPFNFAQHLQRMGSHVRLISSVGCDEHGDRLLETVQSTGLRVDWIQRDPQHPTGLVDVVLDSAGNPAYVIAPDVAYDFIDFNRYDLEKEPLPAQVYFGSLIQRTPLGQERLHAFLNRLPASVQRIYDMNLRQACKRRDIVVASLQQAQVLKLNEQELEETVRLIGGSTTAMNHDRLIRALMNLFAIDQVILTRGPNGAVVYTCDQCVRLAAGLLRPEDIVDTVGAGDAFLAGFIASQQRNQPLTSSLHCAMQLAEKICQIEGAIPSDNATYQDIFTH